MSRRSETGLRRRLRPPYFQAGQRPTATIDFAIDPVTSPRKMLWRTVFGCKRLTIPAAVLMVGHQIGEALIPVVMGVAIDRAVATGDLGSLLTWLLVLVLVFLGLSVCYRFGQRVGFLGLNLIQHSLRTSVTDRILDPAGMGGTSRSSGMLLSIATSDVTRLAGTVWLGILPVGEIAAIVFCAVVLLSISWPLGLAILVGAPMLLWLIDRAAGPLRRRSMYEQELAGAAAGSAADLMTGFRVIKGISADTEAARRYRTASQQALTAVIAAKRTEGGFVALMQLVSTLLVIAVGIAAGLLAVSGQLTIGELITVVGLTQFVIQPLGAMGQNFGTVWASGLASSQRVLSVLQAPLSRTGTLDVDRSGPQTLNVHGVVLAGGNTLTFDVAPSGLTVLSADSDVASELASILQGTGEASAGTITVGGVDIGQMSPQVRNTTVRVAPHSADLFDGSVWENVAGVREAGAQTDEVVSRALMSAACDELVEALPKGIHSLVGEGGQRLSGGQRQRVALARALASDSEILVLVDPTNAVDSVTEAVIAQRLAVARADRATLVITSSPAFLDVGRTVIEPNYNRECGVSKDEGDQFDPAAQALPGSAEPRHGGVR